MAASRARLLAGFVVAGALVVTAVFVLGLVLIASHPAPPGTSGVTLTQHGVTVIGCDGPRRIGEILVRNGGQPDDPVTLLVRRRAGASPSNAVSLSDLPDAYETVASRGALRRGRTYSISVDDVRGRSFGAATIVFDPGELDRDMVVTPNGVIELSEFASEGGCRLP